MRTFDDPRARRIAAAAMILAMLPACGSPAAPDAASTPPAAAPPADAATAEAPPADPAVAATGAAQTLAADATTWTPEALEDLLSPVALYPDPVLAQLLVAVTNPQEVLDAGNWLIANPDLSGKAVDAGAEKAGFTVPMRALMQFPEVVDKLCMNLGWTGELGQAYVNDQQGVMDAVQRLRKQAQDVGNLASSPQMKVETRKEAGQPDVIAVSPPNPQVVYVPQYDPKAVYAPAPATAAPAATTPAPAATATTTTTQGTGHSTGSLVATGLLAFGAGMLVNEIFDDDDYHGVYYNSMWHHPMPYYPPYPYRPVYGPGFYPGSAYHRPPVYVRGGNTIVVNQNNNYYDRYSSNQLGSTRRQPQSPITAATPNRPELQQLNAKAAQGPVRRAPPASEAWKGKGGYAGNDPAVRRTLDQQAGRAQRAQDVRTRQASAGRPGVDRPTPSVAGKIPPPKVQGSYAGARPERARPVANTRPSSAPSNRDAPRPLGASTNPGTPRPDIDRGRPPAQIASRPTPQVQDRPMPPQAPTPSAISRSPGGGASAHAASQRGRQSMPGGARNHGRRR